MKIELDEGFSFGLGAFETIAVEEGKLLFLKPHLDRLETALQFLELGTLKDHNITAGKLQTYVRQNHIRYGACKLSVSKENVILEYRKNPYTEKMRSVGLQMDFSKVCRNETSPLTAYKTLNYADGILEKRRAVKAGMDERIFCNTKGQICEGTVSNTFFVQDQKIITPGRFCGLLPGIIREHLCRTESVAETAIYRDEIEKYEECFVTNSLMGIMPVRQLDTKRFEKRTVTDALIKKYEIFKKNEMGSY